jgi:hypothetical protein
MNIIKLTALACVGVVLAGCSSTLEGGQRTGSERFVDSGRDAKDLSQLVAGVWVDPTGCDHWIIDDGVEGYLSARLDDSGRPVCSGAAPPGVATGPFREGTTISDPL